METYWLNYSKSQKSLIWLHKLSFFFCKKQWWWSREYLEDWIKDYKSPNKTFKKAIKTSEEIINRIPDFPNFIDKANYALQLIAEGKLNLVSSNDISLNLEKMKIKTFQNNMIISVLGIVIVMLLVF